MSKDIIPAADNPWRARVEKLSGALLHAHPEVENSSLQIRCFKWLWFSLSFPSRYRECFRNLWFASLRFGLSALRLFFEDTFGEESVVFFPSLSECFFRKSFFFLLFWFWFTDQEFGRTSSFTNRCNAQRGRVRWDLRFEHQEFFTFSCLRLGRLWYHWGYSYVLSKQTFHALG